MPEINDGGPAFPTTPVSHGYTPDASGAGTGCGPGMTLRQWYAGMAMQGFLANANLSVNTSARTVAEWSFQQADALIEKGGSNGST